MRRCVRLAAVVLAVLVPALAGSGGALAATSASTQTQAKAILKECANGQLSKAYPTAALNAALKEMSASQKQYSPCVDVIQAALAGAGGRSGGGGGGSGGSFLPTPVIVILVILVLAGVTFGAMAVRRRQVADVPGDGGSDPDNTASGTDHTGSDPDDAASDADHTGSDTDDTRRYPDDTRRYPDDTGSGDPPATG